MIIREHLQSLLVIRVSEACSIPLKTCIDTHENIEWRSYFKFSQITSHVVDWHNAKSSIAVTKNFASIFLEQHT